MVDVIERAVSIFETHHMFPSALDVLTVEGGCGVDCKASLADWGLGAAVTHCCKVGEERSEADYFTLEILESLATVCRADLFYMSGDSAG